MRHRAWLWLLLVVAAFPAFAEEPDRRIAVTFDDLPWASLEPATPPTASGSIPPAIAEHYPRLLATLKQQKVPAVGFVNESRLLSKDQLQADRVAMLEQWLDAGLELGNHTASHLDLHQVGVDAYTRDILIGERHLRPMLARRGQAPRWFRHPFLRTGRSAEEKVALGAFLEQHGYRIAPVTVTNSDWAWAAAYRNTLASNDADTQARLRRDYLAYMLMRVSYFERRSTTLLGYPLPQVLLLHANELNAATFADLAAALRGRGYRFVSLEEAMQDPAYQRPDDYTGALGTSWLNRWAIAEKRSWTFYGGEPSTANWVLELAGVASE
ncbi:MAG TPA: polysaccharide deacetylase family protein [Lysobacter sp.]